MLAAHISVLATWLGIFGIWLRNSNTLFGLIISMVAALLLRPIPPTGASTVVPWLCYSCIVTWTFSLGIPSWMH